jgi:CSLREA domain-containing protein
MKLLKSFPSLILTAAILLAASPSASVAADVNANAAITVNSNADAIANDGVCTLREAIINANNNNQSGSTDCASGSGTDTITFAGNYVITLTLGSQLPAVTSPIYITGNDAANTTIQAHANSNTATYRVFEVSNSGNLILNGLTVRNGRCAGECTTLGNVGGGILNHGMLTITNSAINKNVGDDGGGIYNRGTLAIMNSEIYGNTAKEGGGGIYNDNGSWTFLMNVTFSGNSAYQGGGMFNNGSSPTLTNVTFSGNLATYQGGGMYSFISSPSLTNVTFSGNTANFVGGGMYNLYSDSHPTLTNVTFSGNSASVAGGGMYNNGSSPTLINVIIAGSPSGGDCMGSSLNPASSHNLIEGTGSNACGLTHGVNGDIIGFDPFLAPLGNNGGFTQTHGLLPPSKAINKGTNTDCSATDQRGMTRPQGGICDIGAYEFVFPTFQSEGLQDGWILESSETSGKGKKLNSGNPTLNIGDDAANRQYRAILSFDTSSLPKGAEITSVTLQFKYAGKKGTLPFSTHGKLLVDVINGSFSNDPALQKGDFQFKGSKNNLFALTKKTVDGWYIKAFAPTQFQYINTAGVTQFRLRFKLDDNNDFGADFLKIYSGDADEANRPQLIIEYYVQ